MRSVTEVLLHRMTACLISCGTGVGCQEYLQALLSSLRTSFHWIFIKTTWKKKNHTLGKILILIPTWFWYCVRTVKWFCYHMLTTVHLVQYTVYSVSKRAHESCGCVFPILQTAQRKCGDFPCVSTWRTRAGGVVAMLECQHVWYGSPSFLFPTESFIQMLQNSLLLASNPRAMTLIQDSTE